MKENFDYFWKFLIFWEKEHAGDIGDGAGITIYGFTEKYHPQLVKQLKELYFSGEKDKAEKAAKSSARTLYWNALGCDDLPSKLDIVAADCCFNQGIGVAKQVLKLSAQDYLVYFRNKDFAETYTWLIAILKRSDFYNDLRSYDRFGRGWNKRILSLYDYLASDFQILHYD
ncbi:MAG TPA: glycosyl hydrolase 108 family protein [Methanofastidiosum sp.]|nr:glycosyl hydrolase 108 family protein [Methanofastidiosum sp.]